VFFFILVVNAKHNRMGKKSSGYKKIPKAKQGKVSKAISKEFHHAPKGMSNKQKIAIGIHMGLAGNKK